MYDLLDPVNVDLPLEQWQKLHMFDQGDGNTVIQNLQVHSCPDESKAIELMMIGNEIRHMSSTPMNMNSSRSHSIFTIIIECKNKADGTEFRSKLHLVDLAGSERMSKGYVEGNQITETKHINKSLSYLEQVIKCLKDVQQGKAIHVPYRNSLMTMLLKDSLGGNCRTSLITCLSTDVENFEETISTCRFGQRCGQLENVVKKNEIVDYPTMVKRLKSENASLMKELEAVKREKDSPRKESQMDRFSEILGDSAKGNGSFFNSSQAMKSPALLSQTSPAMQVLGSEDITPELIISLKPKIEAYLKEKIDYLECQNLFEAQVCLEIIKQLYNSKMKEYIKELGVISNKLRYYDEYIAKKIGIQKYSEEIAEEESKPSKKSKKSEK